LLTLLAYLDDALEPTRARLVGQTVADSVAARDLLDRIQMLLRDRRIGLPAGGERLDPNTLAAYLDGGLDPARAAEVEETILASDAALAEAAACHQVLTGFQARPEPVPLAPRQRMYGLVRGREAAPQRPRDLEPVAALSNRPRSGAPSGAPPWHRDPEPNAGLRIRKRRPGLVRWLAPTAVVLLLLVFGGIVLSQLWRPNGRTDTQVGRGPDTGKKVDAPPDQVKPPENPKAIEPLRPPEDPKPALGEVNVSKPNPEQREFAVIVLSQLWRPNGRTDTQVARGPDDTGNDASVVKPPDLPTGTKPPDTGKKAIEPLRPPEDPKPALGEVNVSKPNPEQREFAVYAGAIPGVPTLLLQKSGERDTWRRVEKDGRVVTAVPLVSLPGCASELRLDSGVALSLRGSLLDLSPDFPVLQSAVTLHVPEPGVALDCTVQTGRILVANTKPIGEARVRLRFLKEVWDLTLHDGQSAAALELASIYLPGTPFSTERNAEAPTSFVNLFALRGQVDLKIRYQVFALPVPSVYEWNDVGAMARGTQPLKQLPHWYTDPTFPKSPRGQDLQSALEDLAAQMGKKSVEVVLAEARGQSKRREMAILCAGAVDDLGSLADALADEKDDAGRDAAVFALRSWCSREPDNDAKMYQFLCDRKGYAKTQAAMVMELLHLFPREALEKPDTYEKLIANLRHEKLAIRYLSYWHLVRLVPAGRDIKYNPAGDTEVRERGHDKWKKLIPDGALPLKAPAKTT
jgi:hypothetical protein